MGLLIGIGVGILINLFIFLSPNLIVSNEFIVASFIISIIISLSISNIICFAKYILSKNLKGKWSAIIAYYGGCVIGMLIGTELSYMVLWLIYGVPYRFLGHPGQLV